MSQRDDMYYNKVEICGINTSKLKTLSAEETEELLDEPELVEEAEESTDTEIE